MIYINADTPNELSHHCIIYTGLSLEKSGLKHQKYFDKNCDHIVGKFVVRRLKRNISKLQLNQNQLSTSIISLYADLDDENNLDIGSLVEKLTSIYTEAGFKTEKFRDNCNTPCKRTRHINLRNSGCRITAHAEKKGQENW